MFICLIICELYVNYLLFCQPLYKSANQSASIPFCLLHVDGLIPSGIQKTFEYKSRFLLLGLYRVFFCCIVLETSFLMFDWSKRSCFRLSGSFQKKSSPPFFGMGWFVTMTAKVLQIPKVLPVFTVDQELHQKRRFAAKCWITDDSAEKTVRRLTLKSEYHPEYQVKPCLCLAYRSLMIFSTFEYSRT